MNLDSNILKLNIQKKSKIVSPSDVARVAAPKAAQFLYNMLRVGPRVILRSAFELLRANTITRILSAVVLIFIDTISLVRKRISLKQYVINLVLAVMLMIGGTAGWLLGNEMVSLILLENVILGIIAGLIGAGILGAFLAIAWERFIGLFVQSDAADMLDICNRVFADLVRQYALTRDEVEAVKEQVIITPHMMMQMFSQKNREAFAQRFIEPYLLVIIENRLV